MEKDLDFSYKDNIPSQYFEGELIDKWTTDNDNFILRLTKVKRIVYVNGVVMRLLSEREELNFLVPKRREQVMKRCKELPIGTKLQVKLLEESRSKKFTVSKINY